MSARLLLLRATRFARPSSGPRIRHFRVSFQRQNSAADTATGGTSKLPEPDTISAADTATGGTSKLPEPDTISAKICKLEADIAIANATTANLSKSLSQTQDSTRKSQERLDRSIARLDSYIQWAVVVGFGSFLIALFGHTYKMYYYDVSQASEMKSWVRDTVGSTESKMDLRIKHLESKVDPKFYKTDAKPEDAPSDQGK